LGDVVRSASNFVTQDSSATSDGSFAVTIPSTCTAANKGICIVIVGGYVGAIGDVPFLDQLCWDNGDTLDFTEIIRELYTAAGGACVVTAYRMTASDGNWPGTGAKTLYYRTAGNSAIISGKNIAVFFYENVDQNAPIISTDSASDGTAAWTATLADVTADDMAVIASMSDGVEVEADYGAGQTIISEVLYNFVGSGSGDELGEGAPSIYAGGATHIKVAFALLAAAGEAPATLPIPRPLSRPFGGPLGGL